MKRLLYVTTRSPYPLLGGEKNKTFNTIKILSERYSITYCGQAHREDQEHVNELLAPFCEEIVLFESKIIFKIIGLINSLLRFRPLQIGYFYNPPQTEFVKAKSIESDLIFLNIIRSVQFIEQDIQKPIFLDMYDSISEHYKKAVKVTTSPLWKFVYFLESKLMRKYEDRFLPIFQKVFMFNPSEIELYGLKNLCWVPHGVNEVIINYTFRGELRKNNKISFLGKMDYRPNIEAVKWFARNVLPLLPNEYEFQIIGASPTLEVLELSKHDKRIIVTGFVEDPFRLLLESHAVVCPMVSGGGIQNKLLESMALGCINLVSPLCAKPLSQAEAGIIVCESPEDYVSAISQIEMYSEVGVQARKIIKENYTWDSFKRFLFQNLI